MKIIDWIEWYMQVRKRSAIQHAVFVPFACYIN